MNPTSLAAQPQDPASVRARTRDACRDAQRAAPTQHDPIASSWKPAEAHDPSRDDADAPALSWLFGTRAGTGAGVADRSTP